MDRLVLNDPDKTSIVDKALCAEIWKKPNHIVIDNTSISKSETFEIARDYIRKIKK